MCRILFKRDNSALFNKQELEDSYKLNSDGTGLIYFDPADEQLHVQKFIKGTDFEEIYKYVQQVEQKKNIKNIGIHFRFGTGGGLGIDQVHPIQVKDDMWIMHNGVSGTFDVDNANASDTQWMAYWLKNNNFHLENLKDPKAQKIYNNIFSGNKVLVFEKDQYKFINEDLGNWDKDGIWRSWNAGSYYGWEQKYEDEYKTYINNDPSTYTQQSLLNHTQKWFKDVSEEKVVLEATPEQKHYDILQNILCEYHDYSETRDNEQQITWDNYAAAIDELKKSPFYTPEKVEEVKKRIVDIEKDMAALAQKQEELNDKFVDEATLIEEKVYEQDKAMEDDGEIIIPEDKEFEI